MEIDGNAESSVTMANTEWQTVLAILREAPYKVVAPLIEKIIGQCVQQAMPQHVKDRIVDQG
jgi:hypothetical protein